MASKFKLKVSDDLVKLMRHLSPEIKKQVRQSLDQILLDPRCGKDLRDELQGLRSFRLGRLRIVYRQLPSEIIEIVSLGPRSHIYVETLRLLSKKQPVH